MRPPVGRHTALAGLLLALSAATMVGHAAAVAQGSAGPAVIVGHLSGVVNPVSAQYVHRVVGAAAEQGAALLVLVMDTPGGLDSSMRQMVQDLLNSPVPSVVYVAPSGARAASAGVFVGEAANVLAMAPGTNIGAAHPVQGGGADIPADLREKITNDAAAYIASIAKQRGRNDTWVQDAVRQSVALAAVDAVDQRVADLLVPDLASLLLAVEGRAVTTAAGPITIHVTGAQIVSLDPQAVELLADKVFDPTIAYLLMTIGFFAVLIELFHPGALLPGIGGVVCLVLSFVGFAALPMNWGGVVLILAAAALFVLDIKAAAHGGLTIAGLICFILGSLLLYSPPGPPSPTLPEVSVSVPALVAAAGVGVAFSVLVVRTAIRMAGRTSIVGSQRLTGAAGVVRSPLDPRGTVFVAGQVWSARAQGGRLDTGQAIRVMGRTGLVLNVESAERIGSPERNGANR